MVEVELGTYRHFKGGLYEVIGTATHTETNETMVLYRPQGDPSLVWVRPLRMFLGLVPHPGGCCMAQRFRLQASTQAVQP